MYIEWDKIIEKNFDEFGLYIYLFNNCDNI